LGDCDEWKRLVSFWSVTMTLADGKYISDRWKDVVPKFCGYAKQRFEEAGRGPVALVGSYEGWGIVSSFLCQVAWDQIRDQHGNPVFNPAERRLAAELGRRIVVECNAASQ